MSGPYANDTEGATSGGDAQQNDAEELTVDGRPVSEVPVWQLDDQLHRVELRNRYYGLLQELRVVLPGVSVLVGFLLTVAFSERFEKLDDFGVSIYLLALVCAVASTLCCLAPAVSHRTAARTARASRIAWAIRTTRAAFVLFATAMLAAVFCVTRLIRGTTLAIWLTVVLAVLLVVLWVALPVLTAEAKAKDT